MIDRATLESKLADLEANQQALVVQLNQMVAQQQALKAQQEQALARLNAVLGQIELCNQLLAVVGDTSTNGKAAEPVAGTV